MYRYRSLRNENDRIIMELADGKFYYIVCVPATGTMQVQLVRQSITKSLSEIKKLRLKIKSALVGLHLM